MSLAKNIANEVEHRENVAKRVRRRKSNCPNHAKTFDNPIEEVEFMAVNQDDILLGVYGLDDWVTNTAQKQAIKLGQSTLVVDGTWLTPANWSMKEWVAKTTKRFNFMSSTRAILFFDWGVAEVTSTSGKLAVEIHGAPNEVELFEQRLNTEFVKAENLIEWVYSARGDSIEVPLNYRPALKNAYPWIKGDIESYIDDYMDSEASVLILIGPPGTGKTTFIKNLIHRSGANAKITYDEKVMNDDSFFAGFIEGEEKFLIMEDADTFLASRTDGNTMMHRFLNVSDGLISAKDKKLVFSTNLPSVRDVDSALMRPGRCYDVLEFRALTRDEASKVAAELGQELPDGTEFTLTELFNKQPSDGTALNRRVGFI